MAPGFHGGSKSERLVRRRVRHLLKVLHERNGDLVTASGVRQEARHFAAAGLARCRALLEGIYLLGGPKGRTDVAGVLLRSLAETWAISLFVLYRRAEGVFELAPDAKHNLRQRS